MQTLAAPIILNVEINDGIFRKRIGKVLGGDFGIVPTVFSVRYFENNFTIDAAVVFSLYKAGASNMKTLGEYVFNTAFDVVPMVSGSYHF